MQNLKGRNAIVTGAGRGIGREIALLLAREGAKVAVCDPSVGRSGEASNEPVADETVNDIRKAGGIAIAFYDSVADYNKAGEMVEKTVNEFGSIDLMINCAGILRERMIWNMTEEDWDLVIGVHLKGMFNMCHHSIKRMRERGFGRIINFSSGAFKGNTGQCNYTAAKGGIISLSRSIAKETYKFGITCNAICPSADTRMTVTPEVIASRERKVKAGVMTQEEFDRKMNTKRGPEYIAPLIAYLCTDEAYWINGQILHVERGMLKNFYFGETMKEFKKEADEGMFTIDELKSTMPELLKGVKMITPAVEPAQAQKYVNQR